MSPRACAASVRWPTGGPDSAWAQALGESLLAASQEEPKRLPRTLPCTVLTQLVTAAGQLFAAEETLVEARRDIACSCAARELALTLPPQLSPPAGCKVTVVGDTHGQLHDVVRLLEVTGPPGPDSWLVFNGDLVDRGAWGCEVLALVLAWKVALPGCVTVLRGNHESAFCTQAYGFARELHAKYTPTAAQGLYARLLKLFAQLPLGCRVGRHTFVCHGGLYRRPQQQAAKRAAGRARALMVGAPEVHAPLPLSCLGSLAELRHAYRGGKDPDGEGDSRLASDVTWSDPQPTPGLLFNEARGIGLVFGPDATAAFLEANGLRLVIRSHEGPDARDKRPEMGSMQDGWCVDHQTPHGCLATLFSAPCYPQFVAEGEAQPDNRAAVAVLRGPTWAEPQVLRFHAAPRPRATPYYDLDQPGSDEEGPAPHEEPPVHQAAGGVMPLEAPRGTESPAGEAAEPTPAPSPSPSPGQAPEEPAQPEEMVVGEAAEQASLPAAEDSLRLDSRT